MLQMFVQTKAGNRFVEFMRGPRGKKLDKFLVRRFGWSLLMTVFAATVGYPPFPVLLLYTTGRKSGVERSTVMPYVLVDGTIHLIASNGAKPRDPLWVENLRAHPSARAVVRRRTRQVCGRELAPDSDEYQRVWEKAAELTPQYNTYQANTTRRIPILALE